MRPSPGRPDRPSILSEVPDAGEPEGNMRRPRRKAFAAAENNLSYNKVGADAKNDRRLRENAAAAALLLGQGTEAKLARDFGVKRVAIGRQKKILAFGYEIASFQRSNIPTKPIY